MKGVGAVAKKEWKDLSRDRRTVMAAFAYTVFGPLILAMVLGFLARSEREAKDFRIAVAGGEGAPALLRHLQSSGISVQAVGREAAAEWAVPAGNDALLVVPGEFASAFAAGERATVRLYADLGQRRPAAASRQVQQAVAGFRNYVAAARLVAWGVPPSFTDPVAVETADLSAGGAQGRALTGMLMLFFILAPFLSSMSAAIDATAGERERASLQPLLAQPISAWRLTVGKWMVVALFGLSGTAVTVGLGILALRWSPLGELGVRLHLDAATMAALFLALLPLTLLVASLQMWLSLSAKSFKEAQAYLTLLSLAPALLGFLYSFSSGFGEGIWGFFPVISELRILESLMQGGQSPLTAEPWTAALLSAAAAAACLALTARKLGSEGVLA